MPGLFDRWPPNLEPPVPLLAMADVKPPRPPFVAETEQQEAHLATADYVLALCDAELERLQAEKERAG